MGLVSNKTRQKRPKNRKNKIHLVFDEEQRREFLTGFHKRKLQRKKAAQEDMDKQLKEERKRIKSEAKDSYKKMVVSHRTIPELEELLADEYEDDDVKVKVVELSTNDIAIQNHWIGANQPKYKSDEESEAENPESEEEDVPGMELKRKPIPKEKVKKEPQFKSEKEIKKVVKRQAMKTVQKSKVFQRKHKMEQLKQRKKSLGKKKEMMKLQTKRGKRKGRGKIERE